MVFWGAPLESWGQGILDVPEGGIAVLVRDGHAAEAAKLPKMRRLDPLAWDLWLSARFLHVRVAVQTGSTVLHVLCVYGVLGKPELNTELWDSVLQYAPRLGNAPCVIGADFNFSLGELGAVPPVVVGHLLIQRLVDVDAAFAAGTGHSPQCSFHRQGVHPGARIDGVLADPRVAAMVTDVAALPCKGILGHLPVVFTMAMERATQRLVCPVPSQPVQVPKRELVLQMDLGAGGAADGAIAARLAPAAGIAGGGRAVVLLDVGSREVPLAAVGARPAARGRRRGLPAAGGAHGPAVRAGHGGLDPRGVTVPQADSGRRRAEDASSGPHTRCAGSGAIVAVAGTSPPPPAGRKGARKGGEHVPLVVRAAPVGAAAA